jgi:hypothetical protein
MSTTPSANHDRSIEVRRVWTRPTFSVLKLCAATKPLRAGHSQAAVMDTAHQSPFELVPPAMEKGQRHYEQIYTDPYEGKKSGTGGDSGFAFA